MPIIIVTIGLIFLYLFLGYIVFVVIPYNIIKFFAKIFIPKNKREDIKNKYYDIKYTAKYKIKDWWKNG